MSQRSLWDTLPIELQEIIIQNSFQLMRDEYINANHRKHNKNKKKRERGLLTAGMLRYIMSSTDAIEMIQWAFPVELIEFELLIDPPMVEVTDYDYTEFYEIFLQRAIDYLEDPANKNEWICPSEDHWLTMFTRLNNFHRTHKHLDILAEVDGTPDLFVWLEYQKDPDTDLSREKRHSLRSLGVRLPPIRRN
ncbi:hypothetical protein AP053_gp021 [Ostreococcus mediterraneus virus 1]|uniref:hypothetical protein n=1 Tax=Ostreococcus mediterraneus virus 1 TaxID=1663210 RepID=UPI0006D0005B|nr:hypothetical protein AP053_gp021 [Ostreococcus mediterraneus virus 1]ALI95132.1 hypothetical protein OmV1_021 [Ostreococcus mediterraneus virus 1]